MAGGGADFEVDADQVISLGYEPVAELPLQKKWFRHVKSVVAKDLLLRRQENNKANEFVHYLPSPNLGGEDCPLDCSLACSMLYGRDVLRITEIDEPLQYQVVSSNGRPIYPLTKAYASLLVELYARHKLLLEEIWEGATIDGSPFHRPHWTMSHLLKVISVEDLVVCMGGTNKDEYDRQEMLLKKMLQKEESALSDDTITKRLWTKTYQHCSQKFADTEGQNCEFCSICMVKYNNKDKIAVLYYCQHEYHVDCIKKWLLLRNRCPVCRTLAFIPEEYPDWDGADIGFHQLYFQTIFEKNQGFVLK